MKRSVLLVAAAAFVAIISFQATAVGPFDTNSRRINKSCRR